MRKQTQLEELAEGSMEQFRRLRKGKGDLAVANAMGRQAAVVVSIYSVACKMMKMGASSQAAQILQIAPPQKQIEATA